MPITSPEIFPSSSPAREKREITILTGKDLMELKLQVDVTNSKKFKSYNEDFVKELEKGVTNEKLLQEIKKGGKNFNVSQVLALQILLYQLHLNSEKNIDGILRSQNQKRNRTLSETQKSVMAFQIQYGLKEQDGYFRKNYIPLLEAEVQKLPTKASPETVAAVISTQRPEGQPLPQGGLFQQSIPRSSSDINWIGREPNQTPIRPVVFLDPAEESHTFPQAVQRKIESATESGAKINWIGEELPISRESITHLPKTESSLSQVEKNPQFNREVFVGANGITAIQEIIDAQGRKILALDMNAWRDESGKLIIREEGAPEGQKVRMLFQIIQDEDSRLFLQLTNSKGEIYEGQKWYMENGKFSFLNNQPLLLQGVENYVNFLE